MNPPADPRVILACADERRARALVRTLGTAELRVAERALDAGGLLAIARAAQSGAADGGHQVVLVDASLPGLGEEVLGHLAERDGVAPKAYQRARGVMAIQPQGLGLAHVLKYLPHGVGADAFFRLLMQHAEWRTALGHQEALVAWEGPAACHRRFRYDGGWRSVRPDGFGLYRAAGVDHAFHLEWDRGTLRRAHHLRKLAAYRAYVEAGAFLPDRGQLPSLLYVFSRPDMEARTLQLAREMFEGLFEVPILMTSRWRLKQGGPAGEIWASPFEAGRRAWLSGPMSAPE